MLLLTVIATLALPAPGEAQGLVAKGFRFGVSRAVYMDRFWTFNEGAADHQFSIYAGGMWTYWMAGGRLAFQPELLAVYSRFGLELVAEPARDGWDTTGFPERFDGGNGSANRIEFNVPLLFKLNASRERGGLVSVYLGPVLGAGFGSVSAPAAAGDFHTDTDLGPLELGGLMGIGFGFGKYALDFRLAAVGPDVDVVWTPPAGEVPCCYEKDFGINPSFDLSATFGILW